jgi:tetratricopeptide (TPR) repeat protein
MLAACLVATFFQVRSWRDSITVFTRALAVGPKANPIVEHNLGHALSLRGDQPAAIAHFKQALRYVPEFPAAHLNWGNSVGALGNVEEAIQHYHDAIRFQPGYEEAHYQLGNAYALQGKFDEAEASFREAIRWKPDYAEAFLKLANVLDLKGKVDEARSNWSIALKYRPDYDEAHYYLAGSLAREKKFPEAIFHFRVALKSNPTYARALNDLAWILATQDDSKIRKVPDAIHFAEKACRLTNRTNANYLDTFAVALSEAGRFPEATTIASNALRIAELADSSAVSSELQKHLELFKAGKPYREGSQGH